MWIWLMGITISHVCSTIILNNTSLADRVPGQPTALWARPSSDAILVGWTAPEDRDNIRGYEVGLGRQVADEHVEVLSKDDRHHIFRNLEPANFYIISVRAFNDIGVGRALYKGESTLSAQDRPLPSPVDSLIATPDVDSIEVSWAESEEYLIGYRITWSDGLFENEILISDNDLTNYKINNLEQGKRYTISVVAFNSNGQSLTRSVEATTLSTS